MQNIINQQTYEQKKGYTHKVYPFSFPLAKII